MLSNATADSLALDLTGWLAETYLNSTDSPLYSEGTYIMFLDRLAFSGKYRRGVHERYLARLRDIDAATVWRRCRRASYTVIEEDRRFSITTYFLAGLQIAFVEEFSKPWSLGAGAHIHVGGPSSSAIRAPMAMAPVATPAMASGRSKFS